jgi:phenylacetate-CoA ligase
MGRSDDMKIIRGVNVFPSQIEVEILKDQRLSPHYFCELSKAGQLDRLTVVVEARPDTSPEECDAAEQLLAQNIKVHAGVSVAIRMGEAGTIERSLGKAQRIKDLRPKN